MGKTHAGLFVNAATPWLRSMPVSFPFSTPAQTLPLHAKKTYRTKNAPIIWANKRPTAPSPFLIRTPSRRFNSLNVHQPAQRTTAKRFIVRAFRVSTKCDRKRCPLYHTANRTWPDLSHQDMPPYMEAPILVRPADASDRDTAHGLIMPLF